MIAWLFLHFILLTGFYVDPSPHGSHVEEHNLITINDFTTLQKKAKFTNVQEDNTAMILRSKNGDNSLINFSHEINNNSWSFEMVIKNLVLRDTEKAGIYLWYTDKELKQGVFKGGEPIFTGFLIGLEFRENRVDLAFGYNYNLDYLSKEIEAIRYDHINPSIIEHLDHFKFKVIYTEKNFKVELFDDKNSLISDSFRINEPLIMNRSNPKKHFGITTTYENAPNDVYFEIKDIKLFEREEKEKYNHRDMHTEYNNFPRTKAEEEIRTAIADIDHFSNYLGNVIGFDNESNSIIQMAIELRKKTRLIKDGIETLVASSAKSSNEDKNLQDEENLAKIQEMNKNLLGILLKLDHMKEEIRHVQYASKNKSFNVSHLILVCGLLFLTLRSLRLFSNGIWSNIGTKKKE